MRYTRPSAACLVLVKNQPAVCAIELHKYMRMNMFPEIHITSACSAEPLGKHAGDAVDDQILAHHSDVLAASECSGMCALREVEDCKQQTNTSCFFSRPRHRSCGPLVRPRRHRPLVACACTFGEEMEKEERETGVGLVGRNRSRCGSRPAGARTHPIQMEEGRPAAMRSASTD